MELLYIGTRKGMEKKLMGELKVPFYGITCGKLRRYFSFQNLLDFFKIPVGVIQSLRKLMFFRPNVIFCKGGYVCFPVALAGRMLGIPVILHESDVVPGLANSLSAHMASKICLAHNESKKYFSNKKIIVTGNPIRREMAFANYNNGLNFLDFTSNKPIVFFMGGSLGADFINQTVFHNLNRLLHKYQIVHVCGEGNVKSPEELVNLFHSKKTGLLALYRSFPFIKNELKDVYAVSDVVVCRAGAITLAELDFFEKPAILIPLSKKASRGDQITNAQIFKKSHFCSILNETDFTDERFLFELEYILKHSKHTTRIDYFKRQKKFAALDKIINLLQQYENRC